MDMESRRLVDGSKNLSMPDPLDSESVAAEADQEPPYTSLTLERDSDGNLMIDFSGAAKEEEVLRWRDFY